VHCNKSFQCTNIDIRDQS